MIHTPVLIVGAGPAGAAAAATLARADVECLIVDKATFPRDKLCGGLVTERCMKLVRTVFNLDFDPAILNSSSDIKLMMNDTVMTHVVDQTVLNFTMRRDFDHWLLQKAIDLGANIRLGVGVAKIEKTQVVLSDETVIQFDTLIGCDGVNSGVARHLFGQSVEIDFGAANWGYGWAFPKKKSITIGVGGVHAKNPNMKVRLKEYLAAHGVDPKDCKIKGQYIPFGDYRRMPGRDNIVLCGDAAGMVDPITGEGIGYAIQSGASAARAVMKSSTCDDTFKIYRREIAEIHDDLKRANLWRHVIFPRAIRPLFTKFFGETGTLSRGYLDVMAGRLNYSDLPKLLLKRIFMRR